MRGLERDPEKRYATALEFAIALEEAVRPAPARTIGAWMRQVAGENIAKRAAVLADVERSGPTPPPSPSEHSLPQLVAQAPPPPSRLVGPLLAVTALAVAFAIVVAVWALRRSAPAAAAIPEVASSVTPAAVPPPSASVATPPTADLSVPSASASKQKPVSTARPAAKPSTPAGPKPSATGATKLYTRD
jgi:hypothetical protein